MEFFALPFMQHALAAGLCLGLVLPFLGVFVTLRKMSFFGDGIAHASLLGVAVGVVAGVAPFGAALAVGVLVGVLVFVLERHTRISADALIGALFTGALALGLVVMSLQRGYQPELLSFMFGNILSVGTQDVLLIAGLSAAILIFLIAFFRQLSLLALDRETAWLYRVNTGALDLFFYVVVSVAIVLGVKLLGIILVSALLIIPPTIAKMIAGSFRQMVWVSIVAAEVCIVLGLILSTILDLPSGATIVLVAASAFLLLTIVQSLSAALRR